MGGGITYWLQRWTRQIDRTEEREALAIGLAAEIEAYVELVESRNHGATVRQIISTLRNGQDVMLSQLLPIPGTVKNYFPLFFAQLEKIGILCENTSELAKFYTRLSGVFATLTSINAGHFDKLPIANKISLLEEELKLWENTLRGGRAVAIQLKITTK